MTATVTIDLSGDKNSVIAGAGSAIINATRGYLNSTALSHPTGQTFDVYDTIHLGSAGNSVVAHDVADFLQAHSSIYDPSQITIWGDSLSASSFPSDLARILGVTVHKEAIPSQTSTQIAMREGGEAITLSVAGNSIHAGANTITAINGVVIASQASQANPYEFLSGKADNTTRSVTVDLAGITGTVTRTASGGNPSTAEHYTFTPSDPNQVTTAISANASCVIDNGTLNDGTVIFWAGENNRFDPATVEQNIANMVSHLGANQHYLILTVLNANNPNEIAGQPGYNTEIGLNNYLASTYPGHVLDIRELLVQNGLSDAGITPTKLDRIDQANDVPETSLHLVLASGTVGNYIRPANTSFILNYHAGSAHQGDIISINGNERIVAGAGSGTNGYVVIDSTGPKGDYSSSDTFHITTGSGNDRLYGRAGDDFLSAGNGTDALVGEGGMDHLIGGAGSDHFIYSTASDSTANHYDTVTGFNAYSDKFDVPGTIVAVDAADTHGSLSTLTFNKNLQVDINARHLGAHHAVEFTPDAGTLKGDHFLIVDVNGVAGYQANADLVILLDAPVNIQHLSASDFI